MKASILLAFLLLPALAHAQEPILSWSVEPGIRPEHVIGRGVNPTYVEQLRTFRGLVLHHPFQIRVRPLLLAVFFEGGREYLRYRYNYYTRPEETESFADTSIAGAPLEIYYHVLNVVGYRMRMYPETRVSLQGWHSSEPGIGETPALATTRANTIASYLNDIWRISPDRITILPPRSRALTRAATRDTMDFMEARKVEIIVADPLGKGFDLARPLIDVDLISLPQPATIRFILKSRGLGASVVHQTIRISCRNEVWRTLAADRPEDSVVEWDWTNVLGGIPSSNDSLSAQLIVDYADGSRQHSQSVPIPVTNIFPGFAGWHFITDCTLTGFNFDSPQGGSLNERILREYIYDQVLDSTEITITSRTESRGVAERNQRLSQRRAEWTAGQIRKNVKATYSVLRAVGLGEEAADPLETEATPEGRYYNNSVHLLLMVPPNLKYPY